MSVGSSCQTSCGSTRLREVGRNQLGVEGCLKPDGSVCDTDLDTGVLYRESHLPGQSRAQVHRLLSVQRQRPTRRDERPDTLGVEVASGVYWRCRQSRVARHVRKPCSSRTPCTATGTFFRKQSSYSDDPSSTDIQTLRSWGSSPATPFFGSSTSFQISGPWPVAQGSGSLSWFAPDSVTVTIVSRSASITTTRGSSMGTRFTITVGTTFSASGTTSQLKSTSTTTR